MAVKTAPGLSDQETTTIRIVFDGAPFAGKTTAAYALGEALGGTTSTPSEIEGRTAWFDWMTYTGGRHDGKAIRVELVTVPGQGDLSDRRRHLIGWGDVIVFVADTSAAGFEQTVTKFEELQQDLVLNAKETATIVFANKRDLDDVVPMEVVRDRLGLAGEESVGEGSAAEGHGLRQVFIFAVRAALAGAVNRPDTTTADELLEQMQAALQYDAADDAPLSDLAAAATPTDLVGLETDHDERNALSHDDGAAIADAEAANEAAVADGEAEVTGEVVDGELAGEAVVVADAEVDGGAEVDDGAEVADVVTDADLDVDADGDAEDATDVDEDDDEEPAPIVLRYAPGTVIRRPRLDREGMGSEQSALLLPEHWRLLVEVAKGCDEMPIAEETRESQIAADLVFWGLIRGELDPELPDAPLPPPPPPPMANDDLVTDDELVSDRELEVEADSDVELVSDDELAVEVDSDVELVSDDELVVGDDVEVESDDELAIEDQVEVQDEVEPWRAGDVTEVDPGEAEAIGVSDVVAVALQDLEPVDPEPTEPVVTISDSPEPPSTENRNERYRALRELRRSLRRR